MAKGRYEEGLRHHWNRPAIAVKTVTPVLTRRELEVAELVAQGLTNKQIAGKLFIAERTAEYHVEQIRNKLGFHGRIQIAAWIANHGGVPANGHESAAAPVITDAAPIGTAAGEARRGLAASRRLRLALLVIAALAIVTLGVALQSFPRGSNSSPVIATDSLIRIDPNAGGTVSPQPIDNRGSGLAVGSGSVWEISYSSGTLLRIDPKTRAVIGDYGVHGHAPPVGIAAAPDSIWVATAFGSDSLLWFDPKSDQWGKPVTVSSGLSSVAYGDNAIWATNKSDNLLYRIDPLTDVVTARIPVGEGPEALAVTQEAVWVANAVGRSVSRIDPLSGTVQATIALRDTPTGITAGRGAVWVVSEPASALTRINSQTNAAVETSFGTGPSGVAATSSAIWISEGMSGRVSRVDPDSQRTLSSISLNGTIDALATDGQSVWVTRHVLKNPRLPDPALARGGTLRIIVPPWNASEFASQDPQQDALDPQIGGSTLDSNELFRCCLLRTLVSHMGRSYREGGSQLFPDLARVLPGVSPDGLTWTFLIRPGIHYAPPMQQYEIVAADFVRALQRDARVAASSTYSVIEGYDAYAGGNGDPGTISGLEPVGKYILKVHLTQVAGDLPDRFALAESAPIPPSPIDATAPFGAATGHDAGYGRYLVASGPYMIKGSDKLDFSVPANQQQPVSGFDPSHSLILVRNPFWKSASDPLRPAFVDEMRFTIGVSHDAAARLLDTGGADLILNGTPPPQVMPWLSEKVEANSKLGHVYLHQRDFLRAVEMNVAVPPFDDIHVRRAVNYILDKRALLAAHGGDLTGTPLTHYISDSLEGGALSGYDPYATPDDRGSLDLARREMMQSRYDPGHTGSCTVSVCQHVLAVTMPFGIGLFPQLYGGFPRLGAILAGNLKQIGITLDVKSTQAFSDLLDDPAAKIALNLTFGQGSAETWMSASSSFSFDFSSSALGGSLIGATPEQLRHWGYSVTSVPNLDSRIHECMQGGERQSECWTALDIYVMEKVVPIAPYTMENVIDVVPNRVVNYSYDQSSDAVALDQIAVKH